MPSLAHTTPCKYFFFKITLTYKNVCKRLHILIFTTTGDGLSRSYPSVTANQRFVEAPPTIYLRHMLFFYFILMNILVKIFIKHHPTTNINTIVLFILMIAKKNIIIISSLFVIDLFFVSTGYKKNPREVCQHNGIIYIGMTFVIDHGYMQTLKSL